MQCSTSQNEPSKKDEEGGRNRKNKNRNKEKKKLKIVSILIVFFVDGVIFAHIIHT